MSCKYTSYSGKKRSVTRLNRYAYATHGSVEKWWVLCDWESCVLSIIVSYRTAWWAWCFSKFFTPYRDLIKRATRNCAILRLKRQIKQILVECRHLISLSFLGQTQQWKIILLGKVWYQGCNPLPINICNQVAAIYTRLLSKSGVKNCMDFIVSVSFSHTILAAAYYKD